MTNEVAIEPLTYSTNTTMTIEATKIGIKAIRELVESYKQFGARPLPEPPKEDAHV